jgi:transcriptional regulator with XRE-family HTH domain
MVAVTGPEADAPLGERVAHFRRGLGLSQVELGSRINRSESWVSQVERGARTVDRLSVLTQLAGALEVPVRELKLERAEEPDEAAAPAEPYVDQLRLLLSGRPALGIAFGTARARAMAPSRVRKMAEEAWRFAHASKYQDLATLLVEAMPSAEGAVRAAEGERQQELQTAVALAYLALSAVLAKLDERDAAWVAAERAAVLAEAKGDMALLAASEHRMALALMGGRYVDQAQQVAKGAVAALGDADRSDPALESVWGALHLVLAMAAAREGRRRDSRRLLEVARQAAADVGPGRNDFETEFGPANVEMHAVTAAIELGDAGEALELAAPVNTEGLSTERRARLLIDMARAYSQLRRPADALGALQDAEAIAPEQVHDHALVREVVRDLLTQATRRPANELRDFAARVGVTH